MEDCLCLLLSATKAVPSPSFLIHMLIVTCLILIGPDGRVFATRRPWHKSLGGFWEFPGGKVEVGESPEEALRREIREELHLELGALKALTPVEHEYDFGKIHLLPFLARCRERPAVHLVEHIDARWIAPADFATLEWAPADVPILGEIAAILRGV
jgi:8-oxo-dGTP diphosphatase